MMDDNLEFLGGVAPIFQDESFRFKAGSREALVKGCGDGGWLHL